MPVTGVLGAQFGDEGKGKIVDALAAKAHMVIRATGGNNAGHTIHNEIGEFALHLVPAGIFYPDVDCIVGNGTVFDPASFVQEVRFLAEKGVSLKRLYVSPKAHIIFPWHIAQDAAEEKQREKKTGVKIGTTLRGIGPAFQDKASRMGLRVGCFRNLPACRNKIEELYDFKRKFLERMYDYAELPSFHEFWEKFAGLAAIIAPFVRDTDNLVWQALDEEKSIIIEGAQGALLDVDDGMYPYVTSTGCTTAALAKGASIDPRRITRVIGVVKAYTTRIASGPFPTEAPEGMADLLRTKGFEFGATTGRPRRCGWLDIPLLRYSHRLNGFTDFAVTKLDILSNVSSIPFATAYWWTAPGDMFLQDVPSVDILQDVKPYYEAYPSWGDISAVKSWEDMPYELRNYIGMIEKQTGVPVRFASNGPARGELIEFP